MGVIIFLYVYLFFILHLSFSGAYFFISNFLIIFFFVNFKINKTEIVMIVNRS